VPQEGGRARSRLSVIRLAIARVSRLQALTAQVKQKFPLYRSGSGLGSQALRFQVSRFRHGMDQSQELRNMFREIEQYVLTLQSTREQDAQSFAKYNLPFDWELVWELVDTSSHLVECHCELGIAAARTRLRQQGANLKGCFLLDESLRFGFRVQQFLKGRSMSTTAIQAYRVCYDAIVSHSGVEVGAEAEGQVTNSSHNA